MRISKLRIRITYWFRRIVTDNFARIVYNRNVFSRRASVAWVYIRGKKNGIEIGAANNPQQFFGNTKVQYLDRLSREDLLQQIREGGGKPGEGFVKVDIIDEGDTLAKVPDSSQDFVIANHVLEHCENPIGALHNMLRVIKDGGILFLTVPDMRYTFDSERPITDIEHMKTDDKEGPENSRMAHFEEWAQYVEKVDSTEVSERGLQLIKEGTGIHYHSWTQAEMFDLVLYVKRERGDFDIEFAAKNGLEMIIVLKSASGDT